MALAESQGRAGRPDAAVTTYERLCNQSVEACVALVEKLIEYLDLWQTMRMSLSGSERAQVLSSDRSRIARHLSALSEATLTDELERRARNAEEMFGAMERMHGWGPIAEAPLETRADLQLRALRPTLALETIEQIIGSGGTIAEPEHRSVVSSVFDVVELLVEGDRRARVLELGASVDDLRVVIEHDKRRLESHVRFLGDPEDLRGRLDRL